MALRCHICDRDLLALTDELAASLWANIPIWPSTPPAYDGVVTVDAPTHLVSATGGFKTVSGGITEPSLGMIVNIVSEGFFRVTEVIDANTIAIESDSTKPSMSYSLVAGTGKQFVVGGYSEQIQIIFDELWSLDGMIRHIADVDDPLEFDPNENANALIDKALYVPATSRAADIVLKWGALKLAYLKAARNNESSFMDKYKIADAEYEAAKAKLSLPHDLDSSGTVDEISGVTQTHLSR